MATPTSFVFRRLKNSHIGDLKCAAGIVLSRNNFLKIQRMSECHWTAFYHEPHVLSSPEPLRLSRGGGDICFCIDQKQ